MINIKKKSLLNYITLLSWGRLTFPSSQMAEFACVCFAILDYADKFIARHNQSTIRESAERILETYSPKYIFTCKQRTEKGLKFATKVVVNTFYNNKTCILKTHCKTLKKIRQRSKENWFMEKLLVSFFLFCIAAKFVTNFFCLFTIFYNYISGKKKL